MIEKNRYRLGEYQISEYEDGALWWNAHHGFAEQRSGRCFIYEDILVFGEFIDREDGFLKREFMQGLKKLPIWNKTRFYCFLSELLDVSSGQSLSQSWGTRIHTSRSAKGARLKHIEEESLGNFRLDKYIITVGGAKQISWRTLEPIDRIVGGQCMIHSGILFIGPKSYEAGSESGHEFNELEEISPWRMTDIWSQGFVLRPCEAPSQTEQGYSVGENVRWRGRKYPEKTVTTFWKETKKALKFKPPAPPGIKSKALSSSQPQLPASFKFREPWRPLHLIGKVRIFLIPLLLVRWVIGGILSLYLWSADRVATASLRGIIVNRIDAKRGYKRIMEVLTSLKRYLIPGSTKD